MKRVILMEKYEKVDHGCCEDCIAEFKTGLCRELCLPGNYDNPCMGHWKYLGKVAEIEAVEETLRYVKRVGTASCVALTDYGADQALLDKYRKHSGAERNTVGFRDFPNFFSMSHEEQKAVRIKKLTEFLESLK